jgi:hypothetical protein
MKTMKESERRKQGPSPLKMPSQLPVSEGEWEGGMKMDVDLQGLDWDWKTQQV